MDVERLIEAVVQNRANRIILERLPEIGLPDAFLVAGSLFQTVCNVLTGRAPDYGIKDDDIFYFDDDTSWEAEDAVIRHVTSLFSELGVAIEARKSSPRPFVVSGKVRYRLSACATQRGCYRPFPVGGFASRHKTGAGTQ
jgi:hypothetical protein